MPKFSKPDLPNVIWADDAIDLNISQPTNTDIREGWVQEKPPFQIENWSMRKLHTAVAYLNQLGIPEWDAFTEYQAGLSMIRASDNGLYVCIQTHTNRNPSGGVNTAYWKRFEGDRNATTTQTGVTRLATVQETEDATRNDVAVTPFSLGEGYVGNPVGTILTYAGAATPDGYIECDGRALNNNDYPELLNAIGTLYGTGAAGTFRIPDLRGEFLRGHDNGRGIDNGRTLGSTQGYSIQSHNHTGNTGYDGNHNHSANTNHAGNHRHSYEMHQGQDDGPYRAKGSPNAANASGYTRYSGGHSHSVTVYYSGNHRHSFTTNNTGGGETRPRNVAVKFCIKAE